MATFTTNLLGGTPKYGKAATLNEKQRQQMINAGLAQINAIYGGGTAPQYTLATGGFSPTTTRYYNLTGKGFQPFRTGTYSPGSSFNPNFANAFTAGLMPGLGGAIANIGRGEGGAAAMSIFSGGVSDIVDSIFGKKELTPQERAQRLYNQGKLFTMENKTYEGFQPSFYKARENAYTNFALPQLSKQYLDASKQVNYNLANRGLLDSTAGNLQRSDLERTMGQAKQSIADTALAQSQELQREIEASRQAAIAQLYQTGDPSQAVQSAITASSQFQRPSSFPALANAFSNIANQYYTSQLINSYHPGYGYSAPSPYNLTGALPDVGGY